MTIQSSIFIFGFDHFVAEKENKLGFCAWFSEVSAEGTTEKENKKEENKPTMACRHTHKFYPWSGGLMIS